MEWKEEDAVQEDDAIDDKNVINLVRSTFGAIYIWGLGLELGLG